MNQEPSHKLIEIEWPNFGDATRPPQASADEFSARIDATESAMERRGLTHLLVYGDREHFANLAFLTGFDPRYEEALLILSCGGKPLILVGNECQDYLKISPLARSNRMRSELFQPFSLLNQPRGQADYYERSLRMRAWRRVLTSVVSVGSTFPKTNTLTPSTLLKYPPTSSTPCAT